MSSSYQIKTGVRIPELDGLRGLAITLVVFYHYVTESIVPGVNRLTDLVRNDFSLGWSGIDLFFVLSGFLIGGILMDSRRSVNYFKSFYLRRCCRILPLYFLCLILYLIFRASLAVHSNQMWYSQLFVSGIPWWANATFIQNFFTAMSYQYNSDWLGITWTLVLEEQFYLLLPLIIWLMRPSWLLPTLLVLICFNSLFHLFLWMYAPLVYWHVSVIIPLPANALLIGVVCAWLLRSNRSRQWLTAHLGYLYVLLGVLLTGVFCLAPEFSLGGFELDRILYLYFLLDLCFACLLLLAVLERKGLVSAVLRFPPLRKIGIIAYGIYLFHMAINGLLHGLIRGRDFRIGTFSDGMVTFTALLVTLLFASLSWHFFEKPIIRWGHSFSNAKKP